MTSHTPGPWETDAPDGMGIIRDGKGRRLCAMRFGWDDTPERLESMANAERIVLAVNGHDDLLGALKSLIPGAEAMGWDVSRAKSAIAKAEGRSNE